MTYTEDQYNAAHVAHAAERQQLIQRAESAEKQAAETIAALNTAAETTAKRTAQAIAAAKSLLTEQDADKLRAGMAQIVAFAEAPETARQLAEAEAQAAAAQARVKALKAAL